MQLLREDQERNSEAPAVTAQSELRKQTKRAGQKNGPKETSMAPRGTDSNSTEQTEKSSQRKRQPLQGLEQKAKTLSTPTGGRDR